MKTLLSYIFPFKLYLNIFQLEEYNFIRFGKWLIHHFFKRNLEIKRPLKVTLRIKLIVALSIFWGILLPTIAFFIYENIFVSLIILFILFGQPYMLFFIALLPLKPYEAVRHFSVIKKNRKLILSNKKLKVIAITGSFGKSSVKEILYQMMKNTYKTLRTPESFNTVLGINKFLAYEFDSGYEYLICEMAAYQKGEIKELCHMVPPTYGILTGITEQHLERFGSLKNIVSAKFELSDFVSNPDAMVFNTYNQNVANELQKRNIKYKERVEIRNIKFNKNGCNFTIITGGKRYPAKSALFGMSQIKNIQLASEMALKIGMSPSEIVRQINQLTPPPSRSTIKFIDNCQIVDNTFSSNIESFKEIIETAKRIKGRKMLITPGIVELGKDEARVHEELGKSVSEIFDKTILVGKNTRTFALAKGIGKKSPIEFIDDSRDQFNSMIMKYSKTYDFIFLENDLTQNY